MTQRQTADFHREATSRKVKNDSYFLKTQPRL
jgi:hypothetical protein